MTLGLIDKPANFDLLKYAPLEQFSLEQWNYALSTRSYRYEELLVSPEFDVANQRRADDLINVPISRKTFPNMSRKYPRDARFHSGLMPLDVASARRISDELHYRELDEPSYLKVTKHAMVDFGQKGGPSRISFHEPEGVDPERDALLEAAHMVDAQAFDDLAFNAGDNISSGFDSSALEHVTVDINAPTETLIQEFKIWLRETRRIRRWKSGDFTLQGSMAVDPEKWIKQRLLPYLDLELWARVRGERWSDSLMAIFLFPDEVDSESSLEIRVRQTVRNNAHALLSTRMLRQLSKSSWGA